MRLQAADVQDSDARLTSSEIRKGFDMKRMGKFLNGRIALAAVVAALLGAAVSAPPARADTVLFNPMGGGFGGTQTGNIFSVSSFQYSNGNAIAAGEITAINNFLAGSGPTTFQYIFQSALKQVNGSNTLGNVVNIGSNLPVPPGPAQGDITIQNSGGTQLVNTLTEIILRGTVTEQVVGVTTSGGNTVVTFALAGTQVANSVTLAVQASGTANESTGAGFSGGTAILTGAVIPAGFGSTFTASFSNPATGTGSPTSPVTFDQYSQTGYSSPWGTQRTVSGTGSENFQVAVSSVNGSYFQTAPSVIGLSFNPTSISVPYGQEPPATSFWTGVAASVGTLGAVNGNFVVANGALGTNVEYQTTATNNFFVPEPSTIAMAPISMGFITLAGLWMRRRRNAH